MGWASLILGYLISLLLLCLPKTSICADASSDFTNPAGYLEWRINKEKEIAEETRKKSEDLEFEVALKNSAAFGYKKMKSNRNQGELR